MEAVEATKENEWHKEERELETNLQWHKEDNEDSQKMRGTTRA